MLGEHIQFAISSLSCAPTTIFRPQDIVLPTPSTDRTIERLVRLNHALHKIMPDIPCTTSLHVGYMLDTNRAIESLKQNNIHISSVDTPDVRTISACTKEFLTNAVVDRSWKRMKNTLGWQFASVTTIESYYQKVIEGISGLSSTDSLHLVRASTGAWQDSTVGNTLLGIIAEQRKSIPTLAVAIEIDARYQTPEEYFDFVYNLNQSQEVPVYFDLDVGHIAEARIRHRHKKIEYPEILVEKLLQNKKYSQLIGMVSLNQYDHTTDETHISLTAGSIDYVKIMSLLGKAGRHGHLTVDPVIMAEFSPFAYDDMISSDGIEYFQSLKQAFYAKS